MATHKYTYTEYQTSSRPNWVPPPTHPQGSVAPPSFGSKGETRSLAGGGGCGDPIPTKGQTLVLDVYGPVRPYRTYRIPASKNLTFPK